MPGKQSAEDGYSQSFAVTASDTVADPSGPFDAVLCTAAGNATVLLEGSASTFVSAWIAGVIYKLRVVRVNAGALTATLIGLKA